MQTRFFPSLPVEVVDDGAITSSTGVVLQESCGARVRLRSAIPRFSPMRWRMAVPSPFGQKHQPLPTPDGSAEDEPRGTGSSLGLAGWIISSKTWIAPLIRKSVSRKCDCCISSSRSFA